MTTDTYTDSEHMVLVPHTPREDALGRDYEKWLQEVDNPFFNSIPGIVHYSNWRVLAPTPAVPFTHLDFMRVASLEAAGALAANAEVSEFGDNWNRTWGRYPDAAGEEAHMNGHLYLCRRLAGRRPRTRYLALMPASADPGGIPDDAEVWQVTFAVIGDARFAYLVVVSLADAAAFAGMEAALPEGCFGAALAELIASPEVMGMPAAMSAGRSVVR